MTSGRRRANTLYSSIAGTVKFWAGYFFITIDKDMDYFFSLEIDTRIRTIFFEKI